MDNVILCTGCYANNPYYIETEDIHLYSIEELCYYMFKNAWLLEETFLSEQLFLWIEKELGLTELAESLRETLHKENPLCSFITVLFTETEYYTEEKIKLVKEVLQSHSDMSILEKRKCRADAFFKSGRYAMAADEYTNLVQETDSSQVRLKAKLLHNLGVCAAGQFLFEKAAVYYKEAYDTYANTESYVQYLMAKKMSMDEKEYLSFLATIPESYEDSLEVESRIRILRQEYERDIDKQTDKREDGEISVYQMIDDQTQKAMDEYRKMILRNSFR